MRGPTLTPDERSGIEAAIGYVFNDKQRLDRALTHSSALTAKGANYERLEFLGDRVLGLSIAEFLFETFKTANEGELSVRLNQLVSAEACAVVADRLELHKSIRTGADIKKLTGKRMLNVRADVVESLIGAIYLDGGLEAARSFVLRNWKDVAVRVDGARRDAKTELQEWSHAKYGAPPCYRVDDRSGPDHDPKFTVTVQVGALPPETGVERSKRAAEQLAATRLLIRLGIWEDNGSALNGG